MKTRRYGNLVFIEGPKGGRYPFCNTVLIDDARRTLIDPGAEYERLLQIKKERPVDMIINSHYHEDHTSMNYLFPESDLYVPRDETPCFTSIERLLDFYGLSDPAYRDYWKGLLRERFNYREREPAGELVDGMTIDFGNTVMEVIHTPGHTIGHSSFYFPREGLLFLGDLDLTPFGPLYSDWGSDIDETISSVHRLLEIDAAVYITCHEAGVIEGDIRPLARKYLDIIEQRETALIDFLKKPHTMDEIVNQWIIYRKPREPKAFFEFGERGMMTKHLERLVAKDIVGTRDASYYLL